MTIISIKLTSILVLLLSDTTYSQPPAPTIPNYNTCWEIESDPPCNDPYYLNNLGCHYDYNDTSCMCRITDNNINVIYLTDITTSAAPSQSDFLSLAHLIQDVTHSTLIISPTITIYNQIILYDENQYVQTPNIDAETINIDQYQRTQLNDLPAAILTAIQTFNTLDTKRRVLVIFNGQMQADYTDDSVGVCPLKATLDDEGVTVIIVSYTISEPQPTRDLTCLVDSGTMDTYNNIPYSAILGAPLLSWEGFPIEAKLSWDLCETAPSPFLSPTSFPTNDPTNIPTTNAPTTKAPSAPPPTPVTCGNTLSSFWPFGRRVWFEVTIPSGIESITFHTCSEYTTLDTQLDLYDATQTILIASDDNGCNDEGRSKLLVNDINNSNPIVYMLELINNERGEGNYQLQILCTVAPTNNPTQMPTNNPTPLPTIPTNNPTPNPTPKPTQQPTEIPTQIPTNSPTNDPTLYPTQIPTQIPTQLPTQIPTNLPTHIPTQLPTYLPTNNPTEIPTEIPTQQPTQLPTYDPTQIPTQLPTQKPTQLPTYDPTPIPTQLPTQLPTKLPSNDPTEIPTQIPTKLPTQQPTRLPTYPPTELPTNDPTQFPSPKPTKAPQIIVVPSVSPTGNPTGNPTVMPTYQPIESPTDDPTPIPTHIIMEPSVFPTIIPTVKPSDIDYECPINETNWRLKYKHSFVVEKKKKKNRKKGWWSKNSGYDDSSDKKSSSNDKKSGSSDKKSGSNDKKSGSSDKKSGSNDKSNDSNDNSNDSSDKKGKKNNNKSKQKRSSDNNNNNYDNNNNKLASCLVYDLIITDDNNNCYDAASSIAFFMINLPPACDGDISLQQIEDIFYYNSPNNFDIVYDDITQKIGFGTKYNTNVPAVPSVHEFTLCFERSIVTAFGIVETQYFIEGENNYYSTDGNTRIADICKLIHVVDSEDSNDESGYGWSTKGHESKDKNSKNTGDVWSKSKEKSFECKMDETNWNLKYKRSYVSRKKHSNKHRKRGWWSRTRKTKKKRRRMGYKYKFSAKKEEFYEDADDIDDDDEEYDYEDEDVLSSCFVYEIGCSSLNSKCFGSATKILSFSINIPYKCGEDDVSIPEINHAFYWSEPDDFNVVYDRNSNGLAFGLSYNSVNQLNFDESRKFTLCFQRNELNAYNMLQSTWKVEGENKYYSVDGTIYVPDICQLRNN